MEIKLPNGGVRFYANTSENVSPEQTGVRSAGGNAVTAAADGARDAKDGTGSANVEKIDKKDMRELMKQTSDLVSLTSRSLKFEVIEEADLVQIQVIDKEDGRIIRKIPADEVLKLVTQIREKLSEQVDVRA